MSKNDRIIKRLYETEDERNLRRLLWFMAVVGVIAVILAIIRDSKKPDVEQWETDTTTRYIALETAAPVTEETTAEIITETVAETTAETTEYNPLVSLGEFILTAYCPCGECCDEYAENRPVDETGKVIVYTASRTIAEQGRTIAVDPRVIPYGTTVIIDGKEYVAEDTGGAIKGNRIDVYFEDHNEADVFGVQTSEVFIIEQEG